MIKIKKKVKIKYTIFIQIKSTIARIKYTKCLFTECALHLPSFLQHPQKVKHFSGRLRPDDVELNNVLKTNWTVCKNTRLLST